MASVGDAVVTYCGCKISKIRWSPVSSGQKTSDTFVTGSTDNDVNTINLWKFSFKKSEDIEPQMMSEARVDGSVIDIEWLQDVSSYGTMASMFLVASRSGSVGLYKVVENKIAMRQSWPKLHKGVCTSVSCSREGEAVITGGEDGALNLIHASNEKVERTISGAASACINAVKFVTKNEVAFVSSFGTLALSDLRSKESGSLRIFCLPNSSGLSCMDQHPARHLMVTGGFEGSMVFWDIRNTGKPVKVLTSHTGAVWDVRFHPSQPNNLFTCSQDGSLWHWREMEGEKWPAYDTGFYIPQRNLPVNTLDIEGCHLACGTDGEAIFIYPNCVSW